MPTVGTSTYETIFKCIDAIKAYWIAGGKGILGLHVEGPWINKEKRGAHNPEWIFYPNSSTGKKNYWNMEEVYNKDHNTCAGNM